MRTKKNDVRITQQQLHDMLAGRTDAQIASDLRQLASKSRPRKALNIERIAQLRALGCSIREIAADLRIDEKTLDRRLKKDPALRAWFDRGEQQGKTLIRSAQFRRGVTDGDTGMLIWLGKQHLGQKDATRTELTGADGGPIETRSAPPDFSKLTDDELRGVRTALGKAVTGGGNRSGAGQKASA